MQIYGGFMINIDEIDAPQLAHLMASEPGAVTLVDVRTPAEVTQGVLPNAESVPMHLVPLRMDEWRNSQNRIVFYCRTGARSGQVCVYLQRQGITGVTNLRGGIVDWYQQGYSIEMPKLHRLAG
jgi:rhodanese-related sulfurtransferase